MSRRKYKVRYSANVGPMPDNPPPVPPSPPPAPPDAALMNHGGTPQPDDDAKAALSRRIAELTAAEQQVAALRQAHAAQAAAMQSGDPIDRLFPHASPASKNWLQEHREALADPRNLLKLQAGHLIAQANEVPPDTPEYFRHLEHAIGQAPAPLHHAPEPAAPHLPNGESAMAFTPPPAPRVPYGAPVSRSAVAGGSAAISNRVTLTPQERELARLSGVSETEYAAQKVRLARARADGSYSEEGRR